MPELTEDQAADQLVLVWSRTLAGLADGTLSPQHRAFLRLTRPMAVVGDTVLIAAPNDFARDVIGLDRLVALIDPRNIASQHVAAKIGLTHERDATFPTKILRVYATDFRNQPGTAAGSLP